MLSSFRGADGTFQQRTAVTSCTGEDAVLQWTLQWQPRRQASQTPGSGRDAGAGAGAGEGVVHWHEQEEGMGEGAWVVVSCRRDPCTDEPLPTTPHPRCVHAVCWKKLHARDSCNGCTSNKVQWLPPTHDFAAQLALVNSASRYCRSSPEAAVKAQLDALRRCDTFEAAQFNMWVGTIEAARFNMWVGV